MPSDYNAITGHNERQLGQDTSSRKTQISMYSDSTHFVYEILQNADDYGATEVFFKLSENELLIEHDGKPFIEENVRAITYFGKSTSRDDLVKTGRFGVGFKSVFAFTAMPIIISGDEHFQIYGLYRVKEYPYPDGFLHSRTRIILPFNHASEQPDYVEDLISQEEAYRKISTRLTTLNMNTLLFTQNIREIRWEIGGRSGHYLREDDIKDNARWTTITDGEHLKKYLVFSRTPRWKNQEYKAVEIVFGIDEKEQITSVDDFLYVLFATKQETHLQFILNGPYRTNPSRERVSEDDPFNLHLIKETCEVVVESLRQLKKMDLLSASLLEALPIRADDFPENSMFYPIFSRVRKALLSEELLPAEDGTFVAASNAKLARGAELMKLLGQGQLQALFQSDGEIRWLPGRITQDRTPDLRLYLRNELKIDEIDPEMFARNLSKEFLVEQTDEWFIKFYQFLSTQKALWRPSRQTWDKGGILRSKPILRLQNGSHVNPFRSNSLPTAYLATNTETLLPIVKVKLSSDEEAQKFLKELGVPELDIVEEVIGKILPKYTDDSATVDPEENERDLKKIERAYKTDSAGKKKRLQKELFETPFILSKFQNGEKRYCRPNQVYFETDELSLYFSGNDLYGFVDLRYPESVRILLENLGVTNSVRVRKRGKDTRGHVILANCRGWHKRGINGFDPDIEVDGLENSIEHSSVEKSVFIWNEIAAPHSDCICGVVESSSRQTYEDSRKNERVSENFGRLLIDNAWLPNSDGHMHKPNELTLDDLPESFARNEKLEDQLGMKKNVVAKLAEEIGVEAEDIEAIRQNPEEFKQWKETVRKKAKPAFPTRAVNNSERREKRLSEQHNTAPEKEYEIRERSVRTTRGMIDPDTWLKNQYTNDADRMVCQICKDEMPFRKLDGQYYFESVEALSKEYFSKEHEAQFLALCPLCAAMYKEFVKNAEGVTPDVKNKLANSTDLEIPLRLGELDTSIRFVETHRQDLKTILQN